MNNSNNKGSPFPWLLMLGVVAVIGALIGNGIIGVSYNPAVSQPQATMVPPSVVTQVINGTPVYVVVTAVPGPANDPMNNAVASMQPSDTPGPTATPGPTSTPEPFFDQSAGENDQLRLELNSRIEGYTLAQVAHATGAMLQVCADGYHTQVASVTVFGRNFTLPDSEEEIHAVGCALIYAGFNLANIGRSAYTEYPNDDFASTGLIDKETGKEVFEPSAKITLRGYPCITAWQPQISGLQFGLMAEPADYARWVQDLRGQGYNEVGSSQLAQEDWARKILSEDNLQLVLNEAARSFLSGELYKIFSSWYGGKLPGLRSVEFTTEIDASGGSLSTDLAGNRRFEPIYCTDNSPVKP